MAATVAVEVQGGVTTVDVEVRRSDDSWRWDECGDSSCRGGPGRDDDRCRCCRDGDRVTTAAEEVGC